MFQIPEFGAQANLPALRNLASHTQGEIINQTYLANGINSDTLPKEDKKKPLNRNKKCAHRYRISFGHGYQGMWHYLYEIQPTRKEIKFPIMFVLPPLQSGCNLNEIA